MSDDADEPLKQSSDRFLDGHLTPELERHCRNVGRVAVEFACLEEDIGKLVAALGAGHTGGPEGYMVYVKYSSDIPLRLRKLARKEAADLAVDLDVLAADYDRYKLERDRYAHASVGGVITQDPETGVHVLKMHKQKHARGASHPKGTISDLPTDDETDALCREMRAARLKLMTTTTALIATSAVNHQMRAAENILKKVFDDMNSTVAGVVSRSLAGVLHAAGRRPGDDEDQPEK